MPTTNLRVHQRWMIRRDMSEVLSIEAASFAYPWQEDDFLRVLRQRNSIGMIAEFGERVIGYYVYSLHEANIELLTLAVDYRFRCQGVGRQMVDKLVAKLSPDRRRRIVLRVHDRDLDAQRFWRQVGFRAVGVEREYYEDTGDDSYVFCYELTEDCS